MTQRGSVYQIIWTRQWQEITWDSSYLDKQWTMGRPGLTWPSREQLMHELVRVVGNQTQDPSIRNYSCGITI